MNKVERVVAVLRGCRPDHPPVSFWHHFGPGEVAGRAAVQAHLRHLERFDLDFLKIMNDNRYPREGDGPAVTRVADLRRLRTYDGTETTFGSQLEVIRGIVEQTRGHVLSCTTVFNAWTTLRHLVAPAESSHGPPKMQGFDERDDRITQLLREDRRAVAEALAVIGQSLSHFARECIRAGADGIFLSVRDDWVDRPENGPDTYEEMVRATDIEILRGASGGTFNVLHVCGRAVDFAAFARYPVHVLNWADRAAGPSIAYARDRVKPALSGGVDNLKELPCGTPEQVAAQVRDAVRQARHRPILITPGCTYDPALVPEANLRAMVRAAREIAAGAGPP